LFVTSNYIRINITIRTGGRFSCPVAAVVRFKKSNSIELVATTLTGQEPPKNVNEFVIEDNEIKSCPAGHAPKDCTYNEEKGAYRAHFDKSTYESCLHKETCPVIMWFGFKVGAINVKRLIAATTAGASPRPTQAFGFLTDYIFLKSCSGNNYCRSSGGYAA